MPASLTLGGRCFLGHGARLFRSIHRPTFRGAIPSQAIQLSRQMRAVPVWLASEWTYRLPPEGNERFLTLP